MKLKMSLKRLRECYMFAHLTCCILTASYLISWLSTMLSIMQLNQSDSYLYIIIWIVCMIATLALIPAQHKIISRTFNQEEEGLFWYKIIYTVTVCAIYLPIITGLSKGEEPGVLIIVPVILNSIICGTQYGIVTSFIISIFILSAGANQSMLSPGLLTNQSLSFLLLVTTAWFIGQSFKYIKDLFYQLAESERHRNNLLDSLGIATLHINDSGHVLYSNRCYVDLFGDINCENNHLKGFLKKNLPFLYVNNSSNISQLITHLLEISPVFGQAVDHRGHRIPVQCITHRISSGLSNEDGVVICIQNISLSKRLEEEKARTSYIFDFFKAGLILTDSSGKIIEVNQQAEKLLDLSRGNLLNQSLVNLINRLTGKPVNLSSQQSLNYEIEIGRRTALLNCTELYSITDTKLGGVCIIHDITENKDMERKMYRSATLSAIGELAAGTAHEIRNPLTSVRGFLQLLQEKKDSRIGDFNDYFEIMLHEVDRINTITTEFLKLAKQEKVVLNRVKLHEIIDSIWDLLKSDALLLDINLVRELDSSVPPIMGDVDLLKQVVINLVNNSLQSTAGGGAIKITVSGNDKDVTLSVADNGTGIDRSILPRIFDPFFTTKAEGTGLGLAITSKIVNEHNGIIKVSSQPDQGTIFSIKFPVAKPFN